MGNCLDLQINPIPGTSSYWDNWNRIVEFSDAMHFGKCGSWWGLVLEDVFAWAEEGSTFAPVERVKNPAGDPLAGLHEEVLLPKLPHQLPDLHAGDVISYRYVQNVLTIISDYTTAGLAGPGGLKVCNSCYGDWSEFDGCTYTNEIHANRQVGLIFRKHVTSPAVLLDFVKGLDRGLLNTKPSQPGPVWTDGVEVGKWLAIGDGGQEAYLRFLASRELRLGVKGLDVNQVIQFPRQPPSAAGAHLVVADIGFAGGVVTIELAWSSGGADGQWVVAAGDQVTLSQGAVQQVLDSGNDPKATPLPLLGNASSTLPGHQDFQPCESG